MKFSPFGVFGAIASPVSVTIQGLGVLLTYGEILLAPFMSAW